MKPGWPSSLLLIIAGFPCSDSPWQGLQKLSACQIPELPWSHKYSLNRKSVGLACSLWCMCTRDRAAAKLLIDCVRRTHWWPACQWCTRGECSAQLPCSCRWRHVTPLRAGSPGLLPVTGAAWSGVLSTLEKADAQPHSCCLEAA